MFSLTITKQNEMYVEEVEQSFSEELLVYKSSATIHVIIS